MPAVTDQLWASLKIVLPVDRVGVDLEPGDIALRRETEFLRFGEEERIVGGLALLVARVVELGRVEIGHLGDDFGREVPILDEQAGGGIGRDELVGRAGVGVAVGAVEIDVDVGRELVAEIAAIGGVAILVGLPGESGGEVGGVAGAQRGVNRILARSRRRRNRNFRPRRAIGYFRGRCRTSQPRRRRS